MLWHIKCNNKFLTVQTQGIVLIASVSDLAESTLVAIRSLSHLPPCCGSNNYCRECAKEEARNDGAEPTTSAAGVDGPSRL